jgi:predicted HAD superfamily Cof-like phosphohydrolase
MSMFNDVREFHQKFGLIVLDIPSHLTKRKLTERIECMQEELDEFDAACAGQDLEQQADALVDLVYFALGTAVMMGLPWKKLWKDVHRANMDKVRGETHRGHKVDVCKPDGWIPPQGLMFLNDAGYCGYPGEERAVDDNQL